MNLKHAVLAAMLVAPVAFAQAVKQPNELQSSKIQLAIKDYQLAQKDQQMLKQAEADSAKALQSAGQNVEATVAKVKKELGLPDDYTFNYQTLQYEKPAAPPAPVKK